MRAAIAALAMAVVAACGGGGGGNAGEPVSTGGNADDTSQSDSQGAGSDSGDGMHITVREDRIVVGQAPILLPPDRGEQITVTRAPTLGTVRMHPEVGEFTYIPFQDRQGEDRFDYAICRQTGEDAACRHPGTVTLSVTAADSHDHVAALQTCSDCIDFELVEDASGRAAVAVPNGDGSFRVVQVAPDGSVRETGASTGTAPEPNLGQSAFANGQPLLAATGDDLVVAWLESANNQFRLRAARYADATDTWAALGEQAIALGAPPGFGGSHIGFNDSVTHVSLVLAADGAPILAVAQPRGVQIVRWTGSDWQDIGLNPLDGSQYLDDVRSRAVGLSVSASGVLYLSRLLTDRLELHAFNLNNPATGSANWRRTLEHRFGQSGQLNPVGSRLFQSDMALAIVWGNRDRVAGAARVDGLPLNPSLTLLDTSNLLSTERDAPQWSEARDAGMPVLPALFEGGHDVGVAWVSNPATGTFDAIDDDEATTALNYRHDHTFIASVRQRGGWRAVVSAVFPRGTVDLYRRQASTD